MRTIGSLFFPLIVAFIFLVRLGCQEDDSNSSSEYSKIVFLSNREAPRRQFDIFIMDPDGGNQKNLTKDLQGITTSSRPVLSPDGKKILFVAFETGKIALKTLDIQRHSVQELAAVGFDTPQASFSPKGDKILYVKKIAGRRQIHTIHPDGSNEVNLSNNDYDEFDPAFSFDGARIVFVSRRSEANIIFLIEKDGSRKQLSSEYGGRNRYPVFSPDATLIAFSSESGDLSNIQLIDYDRGNLKNLTASKRFDTQPTFSADGSKVIFLSDQRGRKYRDICIIDKKGTDFKNLTNGLNYVNQNPRVTPDGSSVIFDSIKFNDSEIYLVDIDGQNLKNLTNHPQWDQAPSL